MTEKYREQLFSYVNTNKESIAQMIHHRTNERTNERQRRKIKIRPPGTESPRNKFPVFDTLTAGLKKRILI